MDPLPCMNVIKYLVYILKKCDMKGAYWLLQGISDRPIHVQLAISLSLILPGTLNYIDMQLQLLGHITLLEPHAECSLEC